MRLQEMDENVFWYKMWRMIFVVLVTLVLIGVGTCQYDAYKFKDRYSDHHDCWRKLRDRDHPDLVVFEPYVTPAY